MLNFEIRNSSFSRNFKLSLILLLLIPFIHITNFIITTTETLANINFNGPLLNKRKREKIALLLCNIHSWKNRI